MHNQNVGSQGSVLLHVGMLFNFHNWTWQKMTGKVRNVYQFAVFE